MDTGKLYQFNPDGTIMYEASLFKIITEAQGYEFLLFERRAFLNLLWEKLPQDVRARNVRTGARVVGIEESRSGVQVQLEDGTVIDGDIVIGADGVNSTVRKIMWEKGGSRIPNSDKTAMTARFQCLFGCSAQLPCMGPDEG
jgi:2-polyprenyl-6-methoxyphenol hydroxylase-like FAD-dependent oxidoreductase